MDDPDPAVVIRADLADKQAEKWEDWLDRLSLAFIEIVLSESLHAPDDLYDFLDELDETGLELLEQHYTPLPFPAYPTCATPPGTRWFTGPDVILRDDDGVCLMARARTEEALNQVCDQLPGDGSTTTAECPAPTTARPGQRAQRRSKQKLLAPEQRHRIDWDEIVTA